MFLVFGGKKDYNINSLIKELGNSPVDYFPILLDKDDIPDITWDLMSDQLILNGDEIRPTAVFLRNDIFNSIGKNQQLVSFSWYKTLKEWAYANQVKIFNKHYIGMNKSYNLLYAKKVGFKIPYTIVSNQISSLKKLDPAEYISKPINGGDYTRELGAYLIAQEKQDYHQLFFIQNKLKQPEMRIYGIGNNFFAFKIISNQLDYRIDKATQVEEVSVPVLLKDKLAALMKKLQLEYAAADFKTDKSTNEYLFLEINSSPMFSRFDQASNNKISKAIIAWHTDFILK